MARTVVVFEDDPGQLDAGADTELAEDLAEVVVHRVAREEHAGGDLAVGQSLGD
jgi:hypothetical protein